MPRVKKPAKVKDLYGVTGNSPDGNGGEHIRIHPYFYGIYYNDNSTAANTETDYCAVDQKNVKVENGIPAIDYRLEKSILIYWYNSKTNKYLITWPYTFKGVTQDAVDAFNEIRDRARKADGIAGKTRYEYVMYDILQNLPTTPNNRLNLPTYNKKNNAWTPVAGSIYGPALETVFAATNKKQFTLFPIPTDEYYYNKSYRPDHRSKSRLVVPI